MVKQNPKVNAQGKKLKKKVRRDVASVLNKNQLVQQKLLGMNPYLQSLLDPFNHRGAKIPDDQCYPSATFSVVLRKALAANAHNVAAICLGQYRDAASQAIAGSLIPVATSDSTFDDFVGQISNPDSLDSSLFDAQAGNTDAVFLPSWSQTNDAVSPAFEQVRLVSAGLVANYAGSISNSAGRIVCCFTPGKTLREQGTVTFDDLSNQPGAKVLPVNQLEGATVIYKPQDYSVFDYVYLPGKYDLGSLAIETSEAQGALWIAFLGVDVGTTVEFTAIFNYEGIPKTGEFTLVNNTPSKSDPIALSHAMNVMSVAPTTVGNDKAALGVSGGNPTNGFAKSVVADAGMRMVESKSPTMTDTLLNVVSGLASEALPVLGPLAINAIKGLF